MHYKEASVTKTNILVSFGSVLLLGSIVTKDLPSVQSGYGELVIFTNEIDALLSASNKSDEYTKKRDKNMGEQKGTDALISKLKTQTQIITSVSKSRNQDPKIIEANKKFQENQLLSENNKSIPVVVDKPNFVQTYKDLKDNIGFNSVVKRFVAANKHYYFNE